MTGPSPMKTWNPITKKQNGKSGYPATTVRIPLHRPVISPSPCLLLNTTGRAEFCQKRAARLGLHPFPIPMLRNSVPYNGRPACIRNRTCVGFACPVDGKNGTHNTVIPTAMATGNCEVRTHCQVAEVHERCLGPGHRDPLL